MHAATLLSRNASGHLSQGERRWLIAGVAGAHLLAAWALLQTAAVQDLVREQAPLVVDFLAIAPAAPTRPAVTAPTTPTPTPTPTPTRSPMAAAAAPPRVSAAPAHGPTPASPVAESPAAAAAPSPSAQATAPAPAVQAMPAAVSAPPAPPPAPPAPKAVAASALRYAQPPQIELPMASRRLGESGTVLLRVVFDVQGRAKQITVQRSSGFARLDEQAVQAMRQARIVPYLDNGQAVEVVAQAPLVFELE